MKATAATIDRVVQIFLEEVFPCSATKPESPFRDRITAGITKALTSRTKETNATR